jgi:hypothetical protein
MRPIGGSPHNREEAYSVLKCSGALAPHMSANGLTLAGSVGGGSRL